MDSSLGSGSRKCGGGCHGRMQRQEHRDHRSETARRQESKAQTSPRSRGLAWLQGNSLQNPKAQSESPFGTPRWSSVSGSACQYRGHGFNPWSGKIPQAAGQLSPRTTTTDPHSRARMPASLCSATRRTAGGARSPQPPCTSRQREPKGSRQDPAQP